MNRVRHFTPPPPHPDRNRGAALLILLLAVVFAFSAVLVTSLAAINPEIERQRRTLEALGQAKQALIAWAQMQGDENPATKKGEPTYYRPGGLPCPDRNYIGDANTGNASGSCVGRTGTSIGRLPWKSLGMDRLRDGYGEALWYAVSDNFRNHSLTTGAINSDSQGSLRLYAADGVTLLTPAGEELAAVVFAPGPPLPGQDRAALPDAAASYLEAFSGKDNASALGPFIKGPARDARGDLAVNDLVIGISARELVAALEKRALSEAQIALRNYAAEKGELPHPAPLDDANCKSSVTSVKSVVKCAGDEATCFGRLPEDVLSEDILSPVALWFTQNGWGRVMIYAIGNTAGCPGMISLGGEPKGYVLIAPGTARAGQNRPSASLSDHLEKIPGEDAETGNLDFAIPDANTSNDQLRAE